MSSAQNVPGGCHCSIPALCAGAPIKAENILLREALEGIKDFAQEMVNDIAADMQEGGSGDGLEKWTRVLAVLER